MVGAAKRVESGMNLGRRLRRTVTHLSVFAVALSVVTTPAIAEDDPPFVSIGAGVFDLFDDPDAAELRVEYRGGKRFWLFKPIAGAMVTTDLAVYPYAGVMTDVYFGRRFVLSPSVAAGLYFEGNGRDLGHVVEFRSGIEAAYRFDDRSRLGLSFYHISNAGLDDENSGSETLGLTYSIPLN